MRPRGGYIGFNRVPAAAAANSAASGVWTLREAESLKRAGTWPKVNIPTLDTYTGAAAAYSLRLLRSAYSGAVVRVRRSSDNAESDFTHIGVIDGTLSAWVGAANDGFVTTWYDQAGSVNLTNGTAATQPRLVSGGVVATANGTPAIDFGLDTATKPVSLSASLASNAANWLVLGVITRKSGGSAAAWTYGRWFSVGTPGTQDYNNTNSFLAFIDISTNFGESAPSVQSGYNNNFAGYAIAYNAQNVIATYKSGGTLSTLVNNNAGETASQSGTLSATHIAVGANITWSPEVNSALWGLVQEVIFYQSDQSANVSGMTTMINEYYGAY